MQTTISRSSNKGAPHKRFSKKLNLPWLSYLVGRINDRQQAFINSLHDSFDRITTTRRRSQLINRERRATFRRNLLGSVETLEDRRLLAGVPYVMANGNYLETFADIANWTNGFAAGTGSGPWNPVAANTTGTIPDGVRTSVSSATFTTATTGGVQRGSAQTPATQTLVFLSTGATSNTTSVAADLALDFTGRTAGTLSYDYATVFNSTGDRPSTLQVYASVDNTNWTILSGASFTATNNVAASGSLTNIPLPSSFNNNANARIRFYNFNGAGAGTGGSRAKISIDNVAVTSTPSGQSAPTITAASGATVDNSFVATFTEDPTWRSAITSIIVGGTTLDVSAYSIAAGQITFTPSASTLLQSSGTRSISVLATGYSPATFSQVIAAGVATKLGISTQPTAPTASGGTLVTQPIVRIQDQYNNTTTSTASVTASVGAGTWTLGGTTSVNAVNGTATFTNLSATTLSGVTGATITFTSGSLTSITSNTFNIPGPPAPTLAAATGATVDSPFTVTFTDNSAWRAAITGITVGGTALDPAAYAVSVGQIVFTPAASTLLQSSGSKTIVVSATGFANASVTQSLAAGVATRLGVATQPVANAANGLALTTQPIVRVQDQYGNTTASTASVTATVGSGTWTLGGTTTVAAVAGTATFAGLTSASSTAVTGATIVFSSGSLTSATSNAFNIIAPIIGWNFGTNDNATTAPPANQPVNATLSNLTRGNENFGTTDTLIRTNVPSSGYAGASGSGNATIAAVGGPLSTTSSAYFQFVVTPNSGFETQLTGISFGARSTSTGPISYSIRSSADNYANDLATGTLTNNSAWLLVTLALTSTTSTVANPLTYRIFGFGGSAGTATSNQGANFRIDDLTLVLNTQPAPPANPTIAITSGNKVYDGTVYVATASITGNNAPTPALSYAYFADAAGTQPISEPTNFGTYYVQATSAANSGNNAAQSAITPFNITQAPLIITASNASKTYGSAFTPTNFTTGTLFGSDSVTGVTLTSAGSAATATVAGSPYDIVPSAATGTGLSNYNISYTSGALTVNQKALTVTANNASKTYGDNVTFVGTEFGATGLVNGDTVTGVTLTSAGSAATATVAGSPYDIVPSGATGTGLGNYNISYANGVLIVNQKTLTVTANNASKTYGDTVSFAGTEFGATGLVNGDTVTGVTLTSAGSAATASVAGSPYDLVPSAATGTGLGNYNISYANGSLTVDKRSVTITAEPKSKTVGQSDPALTFTVAGLGLVNGDTLTLTRALGEAAGTYAISIGAFPASANYNVTYVGADLTITAATVAPTFSSATVNGADVFNDPRQRSMITSLVLNFSSAVNLNVLTTPAAGLITTDAFSLINIGLLSAITNPVAMATSQILVSGNGTNQLTLRWGAGSGVASRLGTGVLGNSLADGNWILNIDPTKVTAVSGGAALSSAATTFGASAADNFFRMYGDGNGDGAVNAADSSLMRTALRSGDAAFDFDGNGSTTAGPDVSNMSTNNNRRRRTWL